MGEEIDSFFKSVDSRRHFHFLFQEIRPPSLIMVMSSNISTMPSISYGLAVWKALSDL